jgi:hypothetical protein
LIWKIKIVEFGLFANAWFSLHKEKVMGTDFILGWLPFSSHIKPLGMIADEEEKAKINPADLPKAFFNKPKYLQKLFRFVPWVIYLSAAFIAILINSTTSLESEFSDFIFLCLADMPYGFYQFVRFAGLIGFAILAYQANEQGRQTEMIIYGGLALLFQPFFKIALGRQMWNIVDVVVGIGLLISIFMKPKESPR